MSRVLCYTENYLLGVGNKYLVDAINALDAHKTVFVYANKDGLFAHDFERIQRAYQYQSMDIWSVETLRRAVNYDRMNTRVKFLNDVVIKLLSVLITAICSHHNRKLFRKVIETLKPDQVICFNGGYPAGYSCLDMILEAATQGIKMHLSIVSMPTRIKWREIILYSGIKDVVDSVIVNSKRIKEDLILKRKFREGKIKVIYNSVSRKRAQGNPDKFLQSMGMSKDKNVSIIGYTGRIETKKGVFYLVKAFAMIAGGRKDIKLLLVGSGADVEALRKYILDLSMQEQILLAGFYDGDIDDVLAALDVYVFPSLWEGLPYSILEAMAAGKIIIATNVGGIPEAITDHEEGLLVPPADIEALKNVLGDVLLDKERYRELGRRAQKKVDKVFSFEPFALNINNIISTAN